MKAKDKMKAIIIDLRIFAYLCLKGFLISCNTPPSNHPPVHNSPIPPGYMKQSKYCVIKYDEKGHNICILDFGRKLWDCKKVQRKISDPEKAGQCVTYAKPDASGI